MSVKSWSEKIKEKRKQTPFREYVLEIASWIPTGFYKNGGQISRYPETSRSPKVISNVAFNANRHDMLKYGREYDFSKNFFENFHALFLEIPLSANISQMAGENTEYADTVVAARNAYLSNIVVENCEDVFYTFQAVNSCKNIFNCVQVFDTCENIYFCLAVFHSYNIFYSRFIDTCRDVWFSTNMIGCSECMLCHDLENTSYCIENTQYTKEAYLQKKTEILKQKDLFDSWYLQGDTVGKNIGSKNVSGMFIKNGENIENGYFVPIRAYNSRNIMFSGGENFYDVFDCGLESKDFYAVEGGGTYSNNVYCSSQIETCYNMFYSYYCNNCNHCLGCIGLVNQSYCIFNKQYSKEDWEVLFHKILEQMDAENLVGSFFPPKMNPFYLNDTFAGAFSRIKKEEALKLGYLWREGEVKTDIPEGAEVVKVLPPPTPLLTKEGEGIPSIREKGGGLSDYQGSDAEGKWSINPEIMKKVIQDEKGNYYRIVPKEYDFLKRYELPLPTMHWSERMRVNLGV